ncbi:hypothetical protein L873DRAFT_1028029 [Choiromyces venosus 120613-1]|uniref:Uncharacterized protein n=1 Tax=Choiromyces venosus 120613-1 TaxID=1336337 RepID=A0A3N4JJP9_9PEZI|nr:hypothetical protein L873DRAFT_1028029 [Choiromyces venosus 120613-1]
MLHLARLCVPALLLFASANGQSNDERDPYSNLRPDNITGLMYYMYRWAGSYYNGTTTLRMKPQDYKPETECDAFSTDYGVVIGYDSVLGIVKANQYVPEQNSLSFMRDTGIRHWISLRRQTPQVDPPTTWSGSNQGK